MSTPGEMLKVGNPGFLSLASKPRINGLATKPNVSGGWKSAIIAETRMVVRFLT